jgi:hypothetical protein
MSNRQIQPVRPNGYQLARQVRPRSLWSQIWTITLQPGYFFRTLPAASDTRQWFWVGFLILALVGFSAVRQEQVQNSSANALTPAIDFSTPPGTDFSGAVSPFSSGPLSVKGPSGGDIPSTVDTPANTTSPSSVSATLTTALIAASHILLGWIILSVLLSEVPLFNGTLPSFSQNLQIAIWASVPIGIMAGIQVIYYSAGGGVGRAGLAGLLSVWPTYHDLPDFSRSLVLSLAIRLTIFWVWSLFLIYRGARNALNGKRWAVMAVVAAWVILLVVVPVIVGTVRAEAPPENETNVIPLGIPLDNSPLSQEEPTNGITSDGFLIVTDEPRSDVESTLFPESGPASKGE